MSWKNTLKAQSINQLRLKCTLNGRVALALEPVEGDPLLGKGSERFGGNGMIGLADPAVI